jgi:hypothetical protein
MQMKLFRTSVLFFFLLSLQLSWGGSRHKPPKTLSPSSSPTDSPITPPPSSSPSLQPTLTNEERKQFISQRFERNRLHSEHNCLIPYNSSNSQHDPRTTLSHQCVLIYLHFHKSGGTTLCYLMTKEGYKGNVSNNCLALSSYLHHEHQYALDHQYNFVAHENGLFQPNLTSSSTVYMTTIRHPYDRIISNLHHEICGGSQVQAIQFLERLHCNGIDITTASLAEIILNPCFNTTLTHITSNFYLRTLTNCDGNHPCTEDSLRLAIEKMKVMSVIMITDTPEDYEK